MQQKHLAMVIVVQVTLAVAEDNQLANYLFLNMNKKFNINGNEYIFDGNNLELYLKDDEYSNDVDDI